VAEVSLLLLARLKARRLDDYSSLRNYTKKAVGGGDILFLPALNFLYLMGLIEYRLKTDAVEYVGLYAGCNYFALVHHLQHHRGKDSRASPTCDDSSDSMTSITTDRS
jgi:hypothetical protein